MRMVAVRENRVQETLCRAETDAGNVLRKTKRAKAFFVQAVLILYEITGIQ